MCGGVQKVSRPIERCHEMSQWPPTIAEVTATTVHQTNHGIEGVRSAGSILYSATREGSVNIPERHACGTWRSTMKRPRLSHEPQRSRIEESLDTALSPRAEYGVGIGHDLGVDGEGPAVREVEDARAQAAGVGHRRVEEDAGAARLQRAELAADELERAVGLVDRVVRAAQAGQIAHGAVAAVEHQAARERHLDGDDEVEAVDEQHAAGGGGALEGARLAAGALLGRAEHAAERQPLARLELVVVANDLDGGGAGVAAAEQEHDLLGGGAHALELGAVEQTQILGVRTAMMLPVRHWAFIIVAAPC